MSSERSLLTRSNVILVVGALISPWLLCQVWILTSAGDEPFDEMPTCESTSMNCAHLGGNADFRMEELSLTVNASIEEVQLDLEAYIASNKGDVLVAESGDGAHYVHFVERTSFWRFPDDVVVGLTALDEVTTQIELHSQSRLGQGDLGVNPDRLEGLHAALVA
ncbi:MAG: DUF1499 domain-containing protein [Candidatus Poseidoniaceae archaeon]|tara:strand:+ start:2882 stop:3373 length:492 start_codon:yes stop_codon:yes gene_type:complete